MKRVALIRNSYAHDVGGAEKFPANLGKTLAGLDYEPVVLSANRKTLDIARSAGLNAATSPWWSFQNFSGCNVLLFPIYLLWMLAVTAWYVYFFLKNRIDIVHPQSRDDFVAATFAGRLLRRRVIWTDHADLKYVFMNHKKWYKNPVGKIAYLASLLADHIMIGSQSEKKLIEQSLGKALSTKYQVVHMGVVDEYKATGRKNDKPIFVSTSRLVSSKGIAELIEAFISLPGSAAVLKLCGDGPEANRFRALAEGAPNIKFLGHVDDVVQVLRHADVLVHPSYHESFGLSLVEAEMCALPIIACRVDSIPEIVKDGVSGILVRPENSKDLAGAMTRIIKDPKRLVEMGQAGRQIYLENFQLDKIVAEKFLPLYER